MLLPFEGDYQPGHARNAGEYRFICLLCLTDVSVLVDAMELELTRNLRL